MARRATHKTGYKMFRKMLKSMENKMIKDFHSNGQNFGGIIAQLLMRSVGLRVVPAISALITPVAGLLGPDLANSIWNTMGGRVAVHVGRSLGGMIATALARILLKRSKPWVQWRRLSTAEKQKFKAQAATYNLRYNV